MYDKKQMHAEIPAVGTVSQAGSENLKDDNQLFMADNVFNMSYINHFMALLGIKPRWLTVRGIHP